jgi:hypothetical protein
VDLLRSIIALCILWMLARVARVAWRQRALTVTVWRAIRFRHLIGAFGLLVLVAGVASTLVLWVPGAEHGLGRFVGLAGNAVFAPLEEGLARAGPPPTNGPDWLLLLGVSLFLGPLLLLLPWLAFVEEEVFRAGLEDAGVGRVALASLVFGLAHLVMLVPIGAALAIGVAGGAYAAIYRRAFAATSTAGAPVAPECVLRAYRPTRRARASAARARADAATLRSDASLDPGPWSPLDPGGPPPRAHGPEIRQAAAVFTTAVWHTTFNSVLIVLVWLGFAAAAFSPMAE